MKALEMVCRLESVAAVVEAAGVEPYSLRITDEGRLVSVHCSYVEDVDAVAELLDHSDEDPGCDDDQPFYDRRGVFDEVVKVEVYSVRDHRPRPRLVSVQDLADLRVVSKGLTS